MRLQQAQKVCIQGIRLAASGNPLDSIVEGFVILDKGRKRRDMRPRPFWMPLHGITGSRGWFDLLWGTLEGVRDKCYVFRAFHPAGPISKAVKFLKQPAQYDNLLKAFREVLERACNLTPAQVKGYSCHSPRHFLPEVARARGAGAMGGFCRSNGGTHARFRRCTQTRDEMHLNGRSIGTTFGY